jgi:hypothetical protein
MSAGYNVFGIAAPAFVSDEAVVLLQDAMHLCETTMHANLDARQRRGQ